MDDSTLSHVHCVHHLKTHAKVIGEGMGVIASTCIGDSDVLTKLKISISSKLKRRKKYFQMLHSSLLPGLKLE